ncbi:MAG: hypothetical protein ABH834_01500 [Candidatus Altiarchaeota archaeon]
MPAKADEIYEPPLKAYNRLKGILDSYVNKYDRADKFMVAGYNVGFDISFLEAFFRKMGDNYLYSYISSPLDMLSVTRYLSYMGILKTADHKLETVCEAMGIPLEAHNAMSDIRATREIAFEVPRLVDENVIFG